MQEIIRRCDLPVKRRGETPPCGNPASERSFAIEGVAYTADLCEPHYEELRESLARFVAIAQPTRTGQAVRKVLHGKKGGFTTKDVRKWLQEQGRDVASSGRLPNELIEEYLASHK